RSTGQIRARPTGDGATVLALTVPGAGGESVTLRLAVTVGSVQVTVSDFESLTPWVYANDRAPTGSLSLVPGRNAAAGKAIRISYDFTGSTATRGAYARAVTPLLVDGQPQRFGLWVRGDGRGQLLRLQYTQANGTRANLDATIANQVFTGWRLIEFNVPAGVTYPLKIERVRVLETRAALSYTGSVDIDDLVAYVPRSLDLPEDELRTDQQILRQGPLPDGDFRFATLSDVQFTANDTANDRELIQVARQELREIKAENPRFLIINGDFVDTGFPADVRLARQILDEELGDDLPHFYVPGNHEILGPGNLDAWRAEFGADHRTFDHEGIRFVLLNSSTGSLRGSNFEQLRTLRRALDEAATDSAVRGVMVFAHHPTEDPLTTDLSQLGDRLEVAMLQRWLGEFRTQTGKHAAMFGSHAQVVDVQRVDGVPYMVLPAAGKGAYGTPTRGGFNGRANFRVDTGAGDAWLRSEVIATTQTVELEAPGFLDLGERAQVSATAVQPRSGARVPLRYPATARWSGDDHVFVGPADQAERARAEGFTALLDPERRELLALRPSGRPVEISVTSDGVTATRAVRVTVSVDCDVPGVIRGTAKADILIGTPGDDVICAGGGSDTIRAGGGDDLVLGEGGNDTILDGSGQDDVSGGTGDDVLTMGEGSDAASGGAGADHVSYATRSTGVEASLGRVDGSYPDGGPAFSEGNGAGDEDRITADVERLSGGGGPDVLDGDAFANTLIGNGGADILSGGDGADRLSGGDDDDIAYGGPGDDTVEGNDGDDELSDGTGADTLLGGDGDDLLRSLSDGAVDQLSCGDGTDRFALAAGDRASNCEIATG
ncbi:MAG: metallophosphoesterase, partial [Solirubrobacterales bacterium]|nr:metallophosphoesterase [Solirubrobacterales bacterium]